MNESTTMVSYESIFNLGSEEEDGTGDFSIKSPIQRTTVSGNIMMKSKNESFRSTINVQKVQGKLLVQHSYEDYSMLTKDDVENVLEKRKRAAMATIFSRGPIKKKRGGISITFPMRLHDLLDEIEGSLELKPIISWQPHGRAFHVHNQNAFVEVSVRLSIS